MIRNGSNPSKLSPKTTALGSKGTLEIIPSSAMALKHCFDADFVILARGAERLMDASPMA